uniref:Uncharacterized protein n=1 Tax=Nymphaea colorata TaxID=210225 RepID=A0A5K0XH00_9MAGN
MEDVGLGGDALEPEYLVVVAEAAVDDHPELAIRQVSVQPGPELRHMPLIFFQPSCMFHVKDCRT